MKKLKKIIKHEITNRFLSAMLFATMFVLIGSIIPETYYKYFDHTEYLTVRYPMGTDKDSYKPCEKLVVISTYTALQDINATSHNNWMKINEDGSFTKVLERERDGVFLKAEGQPFSVQLDVPCDLDPGTYFLSGIKTYNILGNEHQYSFVSEPFIIEE